MYIKDNRFIILRGNRIYSYYIIYAIIQYYDKLNSRQNAF